MIYSYVEYPLLNKALSSFETEESRWVSDIQKLSNVWTRI